jgi:carbamoylphosphate synthase small subunit
MCTFNDDETRNADQFDYSSLFYNTSNTDVQCVLFDRIMEEQVVPMAAPRILNVAVKYHLVNENEQATNNGLYTSFYENYEII